MNDIWKYICILLMTLVGGIYDIRTRRIPLWLIVLGIAAGIGGHLLVNDGFWYLAGILPGAALLGFSCLMKGQIGEGDGMLFIAVGVIVGLWDTAAVLLMALVLSSVVGCIMMFIRKAGIKYEMPFVPYIFAAEILLCVGYIL